LLANALDPMIEVYHKKPSIQLLQKKAKARENALETALKNPRSLVIVQNSTSPKHILHLIFKLHAIEQKKIFKYEGYENALIYALAHEPEALSEFELDEEFKQQAILAKIQPTNDSGIIVAAKLGKINAIKLLLDWGADIESCDLNDSTALHWAANNGHMAVVNYLLEHGALLEARGAGKNTTLNFAVIHEQGAVVHQLLKRKADINARGSEGMNSLDCAIKYCSELVEPIVMKLATLPADKQAECLLNLPDGPYPNVFFYAALHKPFLFDALITAALEQPDITSDNPLFTRTNQKEFTPLILAAQLGAKESVYKLVELGVEIESCDLNGNTALHWAASNGHMAVVNELLEHGALLEAQGDGKNTALNFAVMHGQDVVVHRLLKENATINARNSVGMNALDNAIKYDPELVEPILMQLATLPTDKQAECLFNLPGGPYPDVFFYAATEKTHLLKNLLHSVHNSHLDSMMQDIYEHIHQIGLHHQKMKRKASHNFNYKAAVSAAETLLKTCTDELIKVHQSSDTADVKMLAFKIRCQEAIEAARPVLTKYREWGKVMAAFLLAVLTLPISLPLYAAGFFSVKTKSEQLLDALQSGVNQLGK
jgi:ankyrin repeat protein